MHGQRSDLHSWVRAGDEHQTRDLSQPSHRLVALHRTQGSVSDARWTLTCGRRLRRTGRTSRTDLRNRWCGSIVRQASAGLNSTPTLISTYVMFVICMLVPTVSYKRSVHERDKKGKVVRMRSIALRFSGRKLAASLVASCSALAGWLGLSGGLG
jgi:hypothetical protein